MTPGVDVSAALPLGIDPHRLLKATNSVCFSPHHPSCFIPPIPVQKPSLRSSLFPDSHRFLKGKSNTRTRPPSSARIERNETRVQGENNKRNQRGKHGVNFFKLLMLNNSTLAAFIKCKLNKNVEINRSLTVKLNFPVLRELKKNKFCNFPKYRA